jgi:hypothetical protein
MQFQEEGVFQMVREKYFIGLLSVAGMAAATAVAAAQNGNGTVGSVLLDGQEYPVVLRDFLSPDQAQPLPDNLEFQRVHISRGGSGNTAGEVNVTTVYQNTNGPIYAPLGVNALLADDMETTAAGGCITNMLEFAVFRPASAPAPAGFTITQLRIFDRCPGNGGVPIVDLLDGTPFVVNTNGAILITIDLTGEEEMIPTSFWIGMAFNKADVGWIGGAAAQIGFTQDIIHVPAFPCNAAFQDPNLYAGMYAEIQCVEPQTFFVAYQSSAPTDIFYGGDGCDTGTGLSGCGDGINLADTCEIAADDLELIVDNCMLHGYSVNVAGTMGRYDMEFELWTGAMEPTEPIPNTRCCFNGAGNGFLERVTCEFGGVTMIPQQVWLVFADNSDDAGPITAGGPAEIGVSEDVFGVYSRTLGEWEGFNFGGCETGEFPCGSFQISLTCIGDEPLGACCDRLGGTCRDDTFIRDCDGRWQALTTCAEAVFDPPCGATACCKIDPQNPAETICEDELPADCTSQSGEPTTGVFCAALGDCGVPACIGATGDCLLPHGGFGCVNNDCCNDVCGFDSFCCEFGWDSDCVSAAVQLCQSLPPPNDFCLDALDVDLGMTSFDTALATTDGPPLPEGCLSGGSLILGKDIWYRFETTGRAAGQLTVELCEGTTYDSRIAVYEGCQCPPTMLAGSCNMQGCDGCDDDGCGGGTLQSVLTVDVQANTCYQIRVGGWGSNEGGDGQMNLSFEGGPSCPDGVVTFVNPPHGVVDARQPHPVNSMTPRQGIQSILLRGPSGAGQSCFSLCETNNEGSPNSIANVMETPNGDGTSNYTLSLARTISTYAVTTVTYSSTRGQTTATGRFTSHPANVNGDSAAGTIDILAIINCLNNVSPEVNCPWGTPFSRDVDQNNAFGPSDLLRVIDLLNGADFFDPFLSTALPNGAGCP